MLKTKQKPKTKTNKKATGKKRKALHVKKMWNKAFSLISIQIKTTPAKTTKEFI